jgi:hypothetical protein
VSTLTIAGLLLIAAPLGFNAAFAVLVLTWWPSRSPPCSWSDWLCCSQAIGDADAALLA